MSWKKNFTYKGERHVEATVGEQEIRFYPNQLGILEKLATLSDPVTAAINMLMGTEGRDYETVTKHFTEGEGESAVTSEETIIGVTSPESMRERLSQREEGIKQLLSMIGDGRNLRLLGVAWIDSMKEIFPRKKGGPGPELVEEFLFGDGDEYDGLEIPQMIQIMIGWMRANANILGGMGEQLIGYVKGQMESRLQSVSTSDSDEGTDPISGEDSKMQLSPVSDSDSDSTTSKSST